MTINLKKKSLVTASMVTQCVLAVFTLRKLNPKGINHRSISVFVFMSTTNNTHPACVVERYYSLSCY